jgi:hypothetical protein
MKPMHYRPSKSQGILRYGAAERAHQKGKVVPVLKQLSTTILDLGTKWGRVVIGEETG